MTDTSPSPARNANLDAKRITVSVDGDTATLTGTVSTWLERDSAERATADAPGIATVLNRIVVEPVDSGDSGDTVEIC
jgi:osmotically-inducible protein OsmY